MPLLIIKREAHEALGLDKRMLAFRLEFIRSMSYVEGQGETFELNVKADEAEGGVVTTKMYLVPGLKLKQAQDAIETWERFAKDAARTDRAVIQAKREKYAFGRKQLRLEQRICRLREAITEMDRKHEIDRRREMDRKRKKDSDDDGVQPGASHRRKRQEVESSSSDSDDVGKDDDDDED